MNPKNLNNHFITALLLCENIFHHIIELIHFSQFENNRMQTSRMTPNIRYHKSPHLYKSLFLADIKKKKENPPLNANYTLAPPK